MGGPSAEQFWFKDDHSPIYDYSRFDVDSPASYRRSVYRFIVRSVPDPFMDRLDCPGRVADHRQAQHHDHRDSGAGAAQQSVHGAAGGASGRAREAPGAAARTSRSPWLYRLALGRDPDRHGSAIAWRDSPRSTALPTPAVRS